MQLDVGHICRRTDLREHPHGSLLLRVCHWRQVDEILDGTLAQILPNRFVLDLDLLTSRMRWHFYAEKAQALQPTVESLPVLCPQDMEQDLQTVRSRFVHFSNSSCQQLRDQPLGPVKVPVQVFALRALEPQTKGQLIPALPAIASNQVHAG